MNARQLPREAARRAGLLRDLRGEAVDRGDRPRGRAPDRRGGEGRDAVGELDLGAPPITNGRNYFRFFNIPFAELLS